MENAKIALVAGELKNPDRIGHHDYPAGCQLLALLLRKTAGVSTVVVTGGWPEDERALEGARSIVFYTAGGGKQAFLKTPQRIQCIQKLVDQGVGIVMIHQAVSFRREHADFATRWIGGVHVRGESGAGHWRTHHREFPDHPVTRGIRPWAIRDGWLNKIHFAADMRGVSPLVWSGKKHRGSPDGGTGDVVSWAFDRPAGGRSFCFSGLDAHSAWAAHGLRQLVANGTLWSAGLAIPDAGAPCEVSESLVAESVTPRDHRERWSLRAVKRTLRRLLS